MKLITWNVQWCRGVDKVVDPARVIAEAKRIADFDVLCLQEVADNFADPLLGGSRGEDQFALLASYLPGFTAVPGVAVDQLGDNGRRRRFGNMILSRLPVLQAFRHLLPYPADHDVPSMPRVAVEAVVRASFGDVRVITTHLEYYSLAKRSAQVEALRAIYAEGFRYADNPRLGWPDEGPYIAFARPAATVITGDFNLEPDDPLHARMSARYDDGTPPLVDAWEAKYPGARHPPTFRIHEKEKPGDPELHCDFIFVSAGLRQRVADVIVDTKTQVSDHQPVLLTLA
ncbi:MAG TPA: endonuclease/exonuclease/phosphatase family protein [Casimicrobiaceae bacterium]|nr:endonuclease/exonuclease/phosphatase family protein [Casimicrobiaceae bacterium]